MFKKIKRKILLVFLLACSQVHAMGSMLALDGFKELCDNIMARTHTMVQEGKKWGTIIEKRLSTHISDWRYQRFNQCVFFLGVAIVVLTWYREYQEKEKYVEGKDDFFDRNKLLSENKYIYGSGPDSNGMKGRYTEEEIEAQILRLADTGDYDSDGGEHRRVLAGALVEHGDAMDKINVIVAGILVVEGIGFVTLTTSCFLSVVSSATGYGS